MSFNDFIDSKDPTLLTENAARYSIEVNYRTGFDEVVDGFAKLSLGYISAGLKNAGYHVKNLYIEKPFRIIISTRNWDDGEWVCVVLFDSVVNKFKISKGFYNKDRKTVAVQSSYFLETKSASEIVRDVKSVMNTLEKLSPDGSSTLNPVPLKRGPKPQFMKKVKNMKLKF